MFSKNDILMCDKKFEIEKYDAISWKHIIYPEKYDDDDDDDEHYSKEGKQKSEAYHLIVSYFYDIRCTLFNNIFNVNYNTCNNKNELLFLFAEIISKILSNFSNETIRELTYQDDND